MSGQDGRDAQHEPTDTRADADAGSPRWLTKGVVSIGSASFFSDAGHELATSVLPSFLTSTLHAGPARVIAAAAKIEVQLG